MRSEWCKAILVRKGYLIMSEVRNHDDISIQIKITGRRAVLRNTIIGAGLFTWMVGIAASSAEPAIARVLAPIFGGGLAGIGVAFAALIGQIAARTPDGPEGFQRTNWRAVRYTGLIGALGGVAAMVFVLLTMDMDVLPAILVTLFTLGMGGFMAGSATILGATVVKALRGMAGAPQQLPKGEFNPLGHPESIREKVRR
jgi:hypothetical protein